MYYGYDNREYEDLELDAMRRDAQEERNQPMKVTAQMIHEAYCVATVAAWKQRPPMTTAERIKYTVMAAWLNEQLATPEERQEPEESGWYPCAQDCGAQVREPGALCEACRACEELGFNESAQPPEEPERRHCGRCHTCGERLRKVLDGEEYCGKCATYRRYPSHGWSRASCSEDELIEVYCPPLP